MNVSSSEYGYQAEVKKILNSNFTIHPDVENIYMELRDSYSITANTSKIHPNQVAAGRAPHSNSWSLTAIVVGVAVLSLGVVAAARKK